MNKKSKNSTLLFLLIMVVIVWFILFYFILINRKMIVFQKKSVPPQTRIFESKDLKVRLELSSDYSVENRIAEFMFKNEKGEILLSRIGTNYETIEDYLTDLEKKNKIVITNKKNITINNTKSMSGFIEHPVSGTPREKVYFYYPTSWTIYSLSTSSEALFFDLDRIAQSFRYAD